LRTAGPGVCHSPVRCRYTAHTLVLHTLAPTHPMSSVDPPSSIRTPGGQEEADPAWDCHASHYHHHPDAPRPLPSSCANDICKPNTMYTTSYPHAISSPYPLCTRQPAHQLPTWLFYRLVPALSTPTPSNGCADEPPACALRAHHLSTCSSYLALFNLHSGTRNSPCTSMDWCLREEEWNGA
jgi:hypothetical protein